MRVFPPALLAIVALPPLACIGTSGATSGSTTSGVSSGAWVGGRSTTSGGTTGGTTGGCPGGWEVCTPANICNNGCAPSGQSGGQTGGQPCTDQQTANPLQTGAACDAGAVCEGSICMAGSGPQVPYHQGAYIWGPRLVLMTYDDDPNQQELEAWGAWVMDGGYLAATLGEYSLPPNNAIGNGTIATVRLSDTKPDQSSIAQYLQTHFTSDKTVPRHFENDIYMIIFPGSWPDTASFCQSQVGYHTWFQDSAGDEAIYAVVADCRGSLVETEVIGSHEIAEAASDPYEQGWTFDGTESPFNYIGGELGDLCESNSGNYGSADGRFAAQYIWSNKAAALGQVPCQPWPAGRPYVSTIGPPTLWPVTPGTVANIPVMGWASAPVDSWGLLAEDAFFGVNFPTYPTMASQSVGPGQQVMVQLNIPTANPGQPALGGEVAGAWVFSAMDDAIYEGASTVGVFVSCDTAADCANLLATCAKDDAGVGHCLPNDCSDAALQFDACDAEGSNDGVCMAFDVSSGFGTYRLCLQAGTLPAGSMGCQLTRLIGGTGSDYCDQSSTCQGTNSPACFGFCTPSPASIQGSCDPGNFCYQINDDHGFCVQECSAQIPCPAGQTCYTTSTPGTDICYPN